MARQRRSTDSATANLDSLLDTMTNVVGILIIVLIVSQLNVSQAVKRIRDDLEPVSEEQMAKLAEERSVVENQIEQLRQTPGDTVLPADIEKLQTDLAKLQVMVMEAEKKRLQQKDLEAALVFKEKETEQLEKDLTQMREQLVGLDSQTAGLDLAKIPPKKVRLPDPRDPYEDASEVLFYCKGGRVMRIDVPTLLEKTLAALKAEKSIIAEMQGDTPIYDREKTREFIARKNISDGDSTVEIINFPDRGWGQISLVPNFETGGESIQKAADPYSKYRKILKRARSDRDYAYFIVHNDAFETYLLARRIAEEEFAPIGWQPTSSLDIRRALPEIRFEHTPPPPPDTPAKPAPPNPKRKNPAVLD